jgi:adenylosuccinate synthase
MPGWDASVSDARTMEALPETVRSYLREVEARTGVEVAIVSVGAERDATIVRREVLV